MKLSLHRVIAEIKHLEQGDVKLPQIVVFSNDGNTVSGKDIETVLKDAQGSIDSELAKAERLIALKVARNKANSETQIVVAGKTMTIDQALATKSVLTRYDAMLQQLRIQSVVAQQGFNRQQEEKRLAVEKQIASITTASNKPAQSMIDSLMILVEQQYPGKIVSAPNLSKLEALEKFVSDIRLELDYVLSEANAKTEVEI